ncbi:SAM-dependent chlorinase/fluorinase [Candidatus Bathyarchaeota archaeon A05DMB-2]|jgi:S-adenosylmethionine hydrolase|nr:SAM-dependent chlorinase/fluorinase [Candidatus Bathyarchaeota archaeon A05DMB-2]
MSNKIITLTTDFGLKDPYAAEMKAAILSICPSAMIIDVTHEIEKFNIRMGAYVLASAALYFPKGTIHVAVVDPGVGTRRRSILIKTRHGFFVGPDNGLLILAAEKTGVDGVYELTNPRFMLPKVSSTFHGRDVFAPAAAHLANGAKPEAFGPEIRDIEKPSFAKVIERKGSFTGEVLHVDGFGNVITNISAEVLARMGVRDWLRVELASGRLRLRFCKAYGEAKPQEPLALIGSHGYLELSVNQGSASERFGLKSGDKVAVGVTEK